MRNDNIHLFVLLPQHQLYDSVEAMLEKIKNPEDLIAKCVNFSSPSGTLNLHTRFIFYMEVHCFLLLSPRPPNRRTLCSKSELFVLMYFMIKCVRNSPCV